MSDAARERGYVVPSYRAPDDAPWYHFLHGNIPGHQIDFMYRPEVPQGSLRPQHFSHLSRLMKYIEPPASTEYAFAIGNLSRDDTQHEPGHGGVALIFGLRIRGVTDHAGRADPPFAHGIAAIGRALTYEAILSAASAFHDRVLGAMDSAEWYRRYVSCAGAGPEAVISALERYIAAFGDLPAAPTSGMSLAWSRGPAPQPARVVIVHADDAPFALIARCAARIAAVLYRSDIRWTAISNGREADVPNGVSIRLVAERDLTPSDRDLGVHRIHEIPDDEAQIAERLFGARSIDAAIPPAFERGERFSLIPPRGARPARDSDAAKPPPDEVEDAVATLEIQRPAQDLAAPCPDPGPPCPDPGPPPPAEPAPASEPDPAPPSMSDEITRIWHVRQEIPPPTDEDSGIDVQWEEPSVDPPSPQVTAGVDATDDATPPVEEPPTPLTPSAITKPSPEIGALEPPTLPVTPTPAPPAAAPESALPQPPSTAAADQDIPVELPLARASPWRWALICAALVAGFSLGMYFLVADYPAPAAGGQRAPGAPTASSGWTVDPSSEALHPSYPPPPSSVSSAARRPATAPAPHPPKAGKRGAGVKKGPSAGSRPAVSTDNLRDPMEAP